MSNHKFNSSQEEYKKLIRGHKLATVEYVIDSPYGKGSPSPERPEHIAPEGLM